MADKEMREVFLEYLGENNNHISGWFILIEQTISYVKFKTNGGNILTIPYGRLIRMKERA